MDEWIDGCYIFIYLFLFFVILALQINFFFTNAVKIDNGVKTISWALRSINFAPPFIHIPSSSTFIAWECTISF